jgi:hypothetical protein
MNPETRNRHLYKPELSYKAKSQPRLAQASLRAWAFKQVLTSIPDVNHTNNHFTKSLGR